MFLATSLLAAETPVNQWTDRPLSGWSGKTYYGNVVGSGFCQSPEGVLVLDVREKPGTAVVRKWDAASGEWSQVAAVPLEVAFRDVHGAPVYQENLHGLQLCFDSARRVLVGLSSTDLDGRGRTIEFDLNDNKATWIKPDQSPPVVTAASLCFDPVNKEVVLATGGFSPVGGTDGTWLYDGEKKAWRRLETPAVVDEVRLPLEKVRDRLVALRWLAWKNLEFRATGREKLLDERATGEKLTKEAESLVTELQQLAGLAHKNSPAAKQPYHARCLSEAAKQLAAAAEKLASAPAALRSSTPAELESIYREQIVPALSQVENGLSTITVTPEPRMSARLVYDANNKVIVCFGGDGQRCTYGDTWVYHCEGRWWERRSPKIHPRPAHARAIAYDAASGLTLLQQATYQNGHPAAPRLWSYDAAKDEWTDCGIAGDREMFWLEYDPKTNCLAAFNRDLNKAWLLRFDAAQIKTVEEQTAASTPEIVHVNSTGEYVLRDAATVADLERWRSEMSDWVKNIPANSFEPVPTHGTGRPNWGRSWSSIVYDPDRQQLYYRDGGHGSYHGADTDHYDLATGRWFRSDVRDLPPWPMGTYFGWGRAFSLAPWCVHTYKYGLFYNPLRKRLQRSIGQSGRMEGVSGNLLEYDPDLGRWERELQEMNVNAGALGGLVPAVPDGMINIDNFTRYGFKEGEGAYHRADGTRQWKNLGTLPRAYDDHSFCWFYDPKRERVLYYGGPREKQELFSLDVNAEQPRWTKLDAKSEGATLPLSSREFVYIPRYDIFLMLAGGRKDKPVEVWALDPNNHSFRQLAIANPPKDLFVSQGIQYDPVTDLCYYIAWSNTAPVMKAFRYVPAK